MENASSGLLASPDTVSKPLLSVIIDPYEAKHRANLLTVWEASVLATHHFLSSTDFAAIRTLVHSIDFGGFPVYCAMVNDAVVGFIGLSGSKIEMLFVAPAFFGKGVGHQLMSFALNTLQASEVDVNEQNLQALTFYRRAGFAITGRSDTDDQGRPYPILKMKRSATENQPS